MSNAEPTNLAVLEQTREEARRTIGEGYSQDLIDADELDRRLEAVERATAIDEVKKLSADLVLPSSAAGLAPTRAPDAPQTALVPLGDIPTHDTITAILSETKRTGPWKPARHTKIRAVLANTRLDFRQAVLGPGTTEIDVSVFIGEVEIFVTPGTLVEVNCTAIIGEVEQDDRSQVSVVTNAPQLRITGTIVVGSVTVRERLDGESWWDARRRRKQERKRLKRERKARQKALPRGH